MTAETLIARVEAAQAVIDSHVPPTAAEIECAYAEIAECRVALVEMGVWS